MGLVQGEKVLVQFDQIPDQVIQILSSSSPNHYRYELSDLKHFVNSFVQQFRASQDSRSHNLISQIRKKKINEFTSKSGLTPLQFSQNLRYKSMIHQIPQATVLLNDAAFDLLSDTYTQQQKVIYCGCILLATQICSLPWFRNLVRQHYFNYAHIFTSPTQKGSYILDIFHPQYRVKSLTNGKPLSLINPEFWGDIMKAESEQLINVQFRFPWDTPDQDKILQLIKPYYTGIVGEQNEIEKKWDYFRVDVLKKALQDIYLQLQKEIRLDLAVMTEDNIILNCQNAFSNIIGKQGFKFRNKDGAVVSIISNTNNQTYGQSSVVVLKPSGEIIQANSFYTLGIPRPDTLLTTDKAKYQNQKIILEELMAQYQPQVIVIGANCLNMTKIRKNIGILIEKIHDRLKSFPQIMVLDCTVPRIFASSQRSSRLFPQYSYNTKQAVSLGRYLLNPLAETLNLTVDPNQELLLNIPLHPFQKIPNQARLVNALECVAVDFSCAVGADINKMKQHPHLRAPLNFIAGLGPVKADHILSNIKRKLKMRAELIQKNLTGKCVFKNAAGFIYIPISQNQSQPLDSTRIHPKYYKLTGLIVKSALDYQQVDNNKVSDTLILKIMRNPSYMDDLDLETYAQIQEREGHQKMLDVLKSIVRQLAHPFSLQRKSISQLSVQEILYNCTGQTPRTLFKGALVQVKIVGYNQQRGSLKCRLQCGVQGVVDNRNIIQGRQPTSEDLSLLQKGETLSARILQLTGKQVNHDISFRVRLSLLQSDISEHGKHVHLDLDEGFVGDQADWVQKNTLDQESRQGKKYVPRVINHIKYQNIGLATACDSLYQKEIGDFVFRPSSRGINHITCTWKFYDGVFSHIDIVQQGKPAPTMLGTKFHIAQDMYQSLQEIQDRYLIPCAKITKQTIAHDKFKDSGPEGIKFIQQVIRKAKSETPTSIPYFFTIIEQFPQFFILCYMPKQRLIQQYIKVKPKGLFFHDAYHPNMTFLIAWFKRHYADRIYQSYLNKIKPPTIDQSQHFSVPGRVEKPRTPIHILEAPPTPRTPLAEHTPYGNAPHINSDQWMESTPVRRTPRMDDRESDMQYTNNERRMRENEKKSYRQRSRSDRREPKKCHKCQGEGHIARDCPRQPVVCFKCKQEGHFARECPFERREDDWGLDDQVYG